MKLRILLLSVAVAVLVIVAVSLHKYAIESPWRLSAMEAKKRIAEKQFDAIVDVRTEVERNTLGSYPNSIHVPAAEITEKINRLFPDKKVRLLLYCNTGQRARAANDTLHGLGYKNVYYISGTHTSIL